MMFLVDWQVFQSRMRDNTVFVKENEDSWDFYMEIPHSPMIKCSIEKPESHEERIMFVERHLSFCSNLIKVIDIVDDFKKEELVSELDEVIVEESEEAPVEESKEVEDGKGR